MHAVNSLLAGRLPQHQGTSTKEAAPRKQRCPQTAPSVMPQPGRRLRSQQAATAAAPHLVNQLASTQSVVPHLAVALQAWRQAVERRTSLPSPGAAASTASGLPPVGRPGKQERAEHCSAHQPHPHQHPHQRPPYRHQRAGPPPCRAPGWCATAPGQTSGRRCRACRPHGWRCSHP